MAKYFLINLLAMVVVWVILIVLNFFFVGGVSEQTASATAFLNSVSNNNGLFVQTWNLVGFLGGVPFLNINLIGNLVVRFDFNSTLQFFANAITFWTAITIIWLLGAIVLFFKKR